MMGPTIRKTQQTIASLGLRLHAVEDGCPANVSSAMHQEENDVVRSQCNAAGDVQARWAAVPLKSRLKILRNLRLRIASEPRELAGMVDREDVAETLAAEVLPLLDACRFLEVAASRILREQTVGHRGRPTWLWGNSVVLRPEPLGVVLIIGPSNYPLMLPGIQTLQAIAAGNAVLVKPAGNGSHVMRTLVSMAEHAGLPRGVVQVLSESPEAAMESIRQGVDKVFLTGSADTGRAVGRMLADSLTPSVMELSGCDAVFVLDDADPELVCDSLLFGLTLNDGRTCMAPRRVFAGQQKTDEVLRRLVEKLRERGSERNSRKSCAPREADFAAERIHEALAGGAHLVWGSAPDICPSGLSGIAVLDQVTADMSIAQSDIFAPVLSFLRVDSFEHALRENFKCPYALSAAVFGSPTLARQVARTIPAGCIVVNDMIVPTADPRVPFGGRGMSGHGMTRGEAGLLEMTRLKAIVSSRRWFKPHLHSPTAADSKVMEQVIRLEHAPHPLRSLLAVPGMVRATMEQVALRRGRRRE